MMKYLQFAAPADSQPFDVLKKHWGISLGKSNQEVEGFRTRDKHFVLWLSFLLSNADVLNLAVMLYDVLFLNYCSSMLTQHYLIDMNNYRETVAHSVS